MSAAPAGKTIQEWQNIKDNIRKTNQDNFVFISAFMWWFKGGGESPLATIKFKVTTVRVLSCAE